MRSHYKGLVWALLVLAIAFIAAMVFGDVFIAYGVLMGGFVLLFVMGVAYMRPRGRPPEHHAKVDEFVNDTKP